MNITKKSGVKMAAGICVLIAVLATPVRADYFDNIRGRFIASKSTAELSYSGNYRLMGMNLKKVANTKVMGTEGYWTMKDGRRVNACLMEITIDTMDKASDKNRNRTSFHNRIMTVMTMPELKPLVYLKHDNEYHNPLFDTSTVKKVFESYVFEGNRLTFYRKNLVTGEESRQIKDEKTMVEQTRQLSSLTKLLSEVYYGHASSTLSDENSQYYLNVDGQVVPYRLITSKAKTPELIMGHEIQALRLNLTPEKGAEGEDIYVWAASLSDLAKFTKNYQLQGLADETMKWAMAPLMFQTSLAVGNLRCKLEQVEVHQNVRMVASTSLNTTEVF